MKNIKKSLLVVPALGVLMLATAGSVGGTVAWFSAVNTFHTDVSSFSVGRLDGSLACTMAAQPAKGTRAGTSSNTVVVGKDAAGDVMMTHGSFKASNAYVYTVSNQIITTSGTWSSSTVAVNNSTFLSAVKQVEGTYTFTYSSSSSNFELTGTATGTVAVAEMSSKYGITISTPTTSDNAKTIVVALDNSYKASDNWMYSATKISDGSSEYYWYYAVGWQMTFSYTFGGDSSTYRNVYFNTASSKIAATQRVAGTGDELTYKGFRLAFRQAVGSGGYRCFIWAPEEDTLSSIHYVTSTDAIADYTDTTSESLWYKDCSKDVALVTDGSSSTATASADLNYLCQLTPTVTSSTIDCIAWFEGSDPNIVNSARLDTVAASLDFFALANTAS